MKKSIILSAIAVMMIMLCLPVSACVGSRPYGMGGAFTPIADSPEAVYWNPAGLGRLKNDYISLTYSEGCNYRLFLAYTHRNVGFWHVQQVKYNGDNYVPYGTWFCFSAGFGNNPYFGFSLKGQYYINRELLQVNPDFGFMWDIDGCSIGVLVQYYYKDLYMIRPGISTKIGKLTMGVGIYPLSPYKDNALFGLEYDMNPVAIRTGYYMGIITFGAGLKTNILSLDFNYWPNKDPAPSWGLGMTIKL